MMAELAAEACVETRQDSPRVGAAEAAELLTQIPEWKIVNDAIDRLERSYRFGSFAEALAFTDRVGAEAEEQNHHPEIVTSYGQTTVRWWTHTVGGLHRNDFVMAARCDAIAAEQPQAMGRIIHFEILGDDPARLADFYGQSLGWQFQVWDEPQPYWLATTRPDKGMGIDGAIMHRHFPAARHQHGPSRLPGSYASRRSRQRRQAFLRPRRDSWRGDLRLLRGPGGQPLRRHPGAHVQLVASPSNCRR